MAKYDHCVYYKYNEGKYPWTARCGDRTGTFATVADIKVWAKRVSRGAVKTFEKI